MTGQDLEIYPILLTMLNVLRGLDHDSWLIAHEYKLRNKVLMWNKMWDKRCCF